MKKISLLFALIVSYVISFSQTMEQVMDKRAHEFHRVLSLDNKAEWKKFIEENYTKALIEKPMKARKMTQGGGSSSEENKEIKGTVEDKVNMLQRLHDDFGGSKIVSIKPNGENLEMALSTGDLSGIVKFRFKKSKPYLIDGIGINVEGGR